MTDNKTSFWFITGSQHLYGPETLDQVMEQTRDITGTLNEALPFPVETKSVVTTEEEITRVLREANAAADCAGVILWMHTFSPAKRWVQGLMELQKPMLHLHTQHHEQIPWNEIDMDFMNLNQSAHGDREFGFLVTRLGKNRRVIAGHWKHETIQQEIAGWMRTMAAVQESRRLKVARIGDNMRGVAVTEGDKVQAQKEFGWTVDGYGIGDINEVAARFSEDEVAARAEEYKQSYHIPEEKWQEEDFRQSVLGQARIELGIEAFLTENGYHAFTTTFEDLHGMEQLPGLAAQRLMEKGFGFAGEGDWKTAALLRMMKTMTGNDRTTFMEDYTYHFTPDGAQVLGSHMLEICPTVASGKPEVAVHPLGIGGKTDPARLIFDGISGEAVNVSLVDMGGRFRFILNEVTAVEVSENTPNLPVAKVLWEPKPDFKTAAEAWIYAGGAHHTVLTFAADKQQIADLADAFDIELVTIDSHTDIYHFRQQMKHAAGKA
ncbi:L-arabinose isomerase [Alkalicoccus urumqiensis]|uniref:L-arabinose isomerase n=2 Tax=Alkalicoccus urumqiensis TaxID=1548213 RepID=A0A2P6MM00_ALKUR|nr:L-arabinose isomerase [Alkalicoccus urumqiensis]PRO67317.1 L-arabinose isomerase [Alkalicoccus urumqiensis]